MTRVLHFIPTMGGGGAERELAHLASPLCRRGIDMHVALISEGPNFDRLASGGAVVHRISIANNHDPRLLLEINRVIAAVKPDLVQTWITQMDVAAGAVARLRRLPWILAERASGSMYLPTFKNRLRLRVGRGADLVQANSVEGTRYWKEAAGTPVQFIPSPVPVAEIEGVAPADLRAYGKRDGVPLILFAGRFHEQKNVRTMLEAVAEVLRSREATVALCGEGPQGQDVRKWLAELGIADRVALPGYVADLWAWMKSADVFLSVSHYEGRPNTVVEAAAARCPLVVSDIPEHREFLRHGVHALLADRHSPQAIAAAIGEVLDDPGAAGQRAAAAREVVSAWTLDNVAAAHVRMYEDVLRYHARRKKKDSDE